MSTSGRRTASAGIPGSGIGYQKSWQAGSRQRARPAPIPVAPPSPPKPDLFAPGYEKAFHKAIHRYASGDTHGALLLFREAAEKDQSNKALGDDFFAGLLSAQLRDDASAIWFLEKVVTAAHALPDQLMSKYVEGGSVAVPVTESVAVEVPFGIPCRRPDACRGLPAKRPRRGGDRATTTARGRGRRTPIPDPQPVRPLRGGRRVGRNRGRGLGRDKRGRREPAGPAHPGPRVPRAGDEPGRA